MPVRARDLDHLVLRVTDPAASVRWYAEHLGCEPVRLADWERGVVPFPSARVNAATIIDFFPAQATATAELRDGEVRPHEAQPVLDHLCLVVDNVDLDALVASGEFDVLGGPAELFGARGTGTSVYVRDLDGTTVELRVYR